MEYWTALARELDLPLVVNGPPDAAPLLEEIRGAHMHLSGISGLIDATRRAHAVVGVDSGPLHLAAALLRKAGRGYLRSYQPRPARPLWRIFPACEPPDAARL
jgi:ADP-heptose:LPS heptosyltransferase